MIARGAIRPAQTRPSPKNLGRTRARHFGGCGVREAEIRLEPVALQGLIGVPADPATRHYDLMLDGGRAYFANDLLVHNRG